MRLIAPLAVLLAVVAFIWGWIANLLMLLSGADMGGGEIVVRALGVIVPMIGAISGYF